MRSAEPFRGRHGVGRLSAWSEREEAPDTLATMLQQVHGPTRTAVIQVAVHSSDPVSRLGAVNLLAHEPRLRVLDDDQPVRADIAVVVENTVNDSALSWLRRPHGGAEGDPAPRCVLVTDDLHLVSALTAVECGIRAVLPRSDLDSSRLVRTVLSVSRGSAHLPPALQGELLTQINRVQREVLEPNGLTMFGVATRERDILRLLADGLGTEEIAAALGCSERTVKKVLYELMTRHGLATRAHAVAFALRAGIV